MALIIMPQSAKDRLTSCTVGPDFPGQVQFDGLAGGRTVINRNRSWAGTLSIAQVDPRENPDEASEIASFVAEWAYAGNTCELPLLMAAIPEAVDYNAAGQTADGVFTYFSLTDPFPGKKGQVGRVDGKLVMINTVGTLQTTAFGIVPTFTITPNIRLPDNGGVNVQGTVEARAEVLARVGNVRTGQRISTRYLPDLSGPWTIPWQEIVGV